MISQFIAYPPTLPAPANDNWDWSDRRRLLTFLCQGYHTNKAHARGCQSLRWRAVWARWLREQRALIQECWTDLTQRPEDTEAD